MIPVDVLGISLVLKIIEKFGSLTLMRIRIRLPEMMRIHRVKFVDEIKPGC
jgi:hypothetical protein